MALLEIKGITKFFGGLSAVKELSFDVNKGEIVGLIGPNGSGKTTTLNIITNIFPPDEGQIIFNGENITRLKAHQIARKGLIRTFQISTLFMDMTVLQNVLLGFHIIQRGMVSWPSVISVFLRRKSIDERMLEKAMELLEFMGILEMRNELAKNLPHGHQRCLALGIALAPNPQLLLLDEPVSGMNPKEANILVERLRILKNKGITILLVEHNIRVVMGICEKIVVLNFGRKIAEGLPNEIKANKEVIKAYLGEKYAIKG